MNNMQTHPSIIIVEDNETLREELALYLTEEGFAVRGVDCGADLNAALDAQSADILILDLNLPHEDGISIIARMRGAFPALGIIVLTARVRSADRIEAYTAGADVYLSKPTRPEELAAVGRNLFGRLKPGAGAAQWQLDVAALALRAPSGAEIGLTGGETRLLKELAFSGQCIDHATLVARLGDELQSEKTNRARIEVLVSRLRAKLAAHADGGLDIKALRGRGYQLSCPLAVKNLPFKPEVE